MGRVRGLRRIIPKMPNGVRQFPHRSFDWRQDRTGLQAINVQATTHRDLAAVMLVFHQARMPGWITFGPDENRIGWIQRKPQHWLTFIFTGLGNAQGTHAGTVDSERNGDGWLNIVLSPAEFGGSAIEVRGEVDIAATDAIARALVQLQAVISIIPAREAP